MLRILLLGLLICNTALVQGQGSPPWQNALFMVQSNDGIHFNSPALFQDSSGVPCLINWKSDTLVCVFQWFRQPTGSSTWDRVAVKFSYDNGSSWTSPAPILVNNLPAGYQRPFDPTLVVTGDNKLRIYFSSSESVPGTGLDASVNTYSAISTDGINYNFEPGARFDHPTSRVIDPAVTLFSGTWHYLSPIGAPQEGAYHCLSADGLIFSQAGNIASDNSHNWTGNFLSDGGLLHFYGCGQNIWFNTSADGNAWNSYVNTNIIGGDPGVVKLSTGRYLMVYVGPKIIPAPGNPSASSAVKIFPNPVSTVVFLQGQEGKHYPFSIYTATGSLLYQDIFSGKTRLDLEKFTAGTYLIVIEENKKLACSLILKK